jgi:BirA family biotin operon repressor/biotin-[acetyl-CoA-carboxylase] ligase
MLRDGLALAVRGLPRPWRGTFFDAVESTQDEARAAVLAGAPTRSIFVADYQRAGRGRQGRTWLAPAGSSLLLSMLFREQSQQPVPFRWTSMASVSLTDAIGALLPRVELAIKWPNDVLLDGRKVAGVLAETLWNGVEFIAIVGIGVNVSIEPDRLEPFGATSLGAGVDRGRLLRAFLKRLDDWLARPADELRATYSASLWRRGQHLRLLDLGRVEHVVVLGVDADGSLRVRLDDGTERVTSTGELIL